MPDDVAGFLAALLEVAQIVGVKAGQGLLDGPFHPGGFQEMPVGIGGDGKTVGDSHPF